VASGNEDVSILDVYSWSSLLGFGARLSNPTSMPANRPNGVHINKTGSLLAATDDGDSGQNVYPLTSIIGTRFTKPTALVTRSDIQFSPESTAIIASDIISPYIHAWAWSEGFGAKYSNPSVLPTAQGKNIAFSPNGNFITATGYSLRYPIAYGWSLSGFGTRYTGPFSMLPTSTNQYGIDVAPDNGAVAVAHVGSPYVTAVRFSASGFGTRYTFPSTVPSSGSSSYANCVRFSPDGAYIAVGTQSSPYAHIYNWTTGGGFGVKLSAPSPTPPNVPASCAWGYDTGCIAFNSNPSTGYPVPLHIYRFAGSFGSRYSDPAILPANGGGGLSFGIQAAAAVDIPLTADVISLTLIGMAVTLKKSYVLTGNVRSISYSGQNALLKKTAVTVASVTNISCSGQNAVLSRSSEVSASAYQTRMANMALLNVDANGNYIDKKTAPISAMISSRMDNLILPNQNNLNSVGYPTLKTYLYLEASQGFILSHINQSQIITVKKN
jgi:hypothetical protein